MRASQTANALPAGRSAPTDRTCRLVDASTERMDEQRALHAATQAGPRAEGMGFEPMKTEWAPP